MDKDEALRLALEYVELVPDDRYNADHIDQDALITAIKAALEAKDEPVIDESAAKRIATSLGWEPQRKPLTDEELCQLASEYLHYQIESYAVSGIYNFARAIEAKLKEKNCADH